jgi:diguanylate cyclase (GGDEF)-like protein
VPGAQHPAKHLSAQIVAVQSRFGTKLHLSAKEVKIPMTIPTVLIVDDNPNNLRVLEGILHGAGYKVRPALNGETALRAAESAQPDLILLDIRMPGMDGFELCRRLKAQPLTRDIPVIFISALQEMDDKIQAFKVGGVDYITKPFQSEEVLTRAHTHIELGQARRALARSNENLEQEVIERTRALTESHARLEKWMSDEHALREMLTLSHDHFADDDYAARALDSLAKNKAWAPPAVNVAILINTGRGTKADINLRLEALLGFVDGADRPKLRMILEGVDADLTRRGNTACPKIGALLGTKDGQPCQVIPLMTGKNLLGVLVLAGDEVRLAQEEDFIAQVAEVLAMGIARRHADEQLAWQAYHDAMTGLPNRRMLEEELPQEMRAAASRGLFCGVLLLDLDQFKLLNDTLGHETGDLLLLRVADRLKEAVRASDQIFRWGGDEFIVLMPGIGKSADDAAAHAHAAAENVASSLVDVFEVDGERIHLNASMGIAFYPSDGESVGELLKHVDLAMHKAKQAGRNSIHFFRQDMQTEVQHHLKIDRELRTALAENQFLLHYQPQVDGRGRLVGAESLVRWWHPERKLVPPIEFIPIAEETGLILPLGEWVLECACRQLREWSGGAPMPGRFLAVNVSAKQFHQNDFVEGVRRVLERTGAPASALELEVTESLLLTDIDSAVRKIEALREMGIRFSVDDFGTGYSSLAYLKRLPVDQLKIDRSFVSGVHRDPRNAAIVRTIISLAANLGMKTIAEGVEDSAEVDFMLGAGCTHFQGYFFSKPLPLTEFDQKWRWSGQAATST